jgi:hypothetical protein
MASREPAKRLGGRSEGKVSRRPQKEQQWGGEGGGGGKGDEEGGRRNRRGRQRRKRARRVLHLAGCVCSRMRMVSSGWPIRLAVQPAKHLVSAQCYSFVKERDKFVWKRGTIIVQESKVKCVSLAQQPI